MIEDLRYAVRALRRSPGFVAAAVPALALAIGANSAIFSVIDGVLLRPLPFDRDGRLVEIYARDPQGQRQYVSQPDLDDWRAMTRSFEGLASWVPQSVNLTGLDQPERLTGMFVSANFLPVLRVEPAIGRGFAPGEDRLGGQRVAIISDRLWHSRLGADAAILGRPIQLNGETYTIVGVLPSSFIFPLSQADVYLPAFKYPNYSLDRAKTSCAVIGRLREGVSSLAAREEMDGIAERLAEAYPGSNRGRGALVVGFRDDIVSRRRPTLIALGTAAGFVLLIGCANIAGLMIARQLGRERDRAVRIALGASRVRLISSVLFEALLLSAAGCALGCLCAAWTIPAIAASIAVYLPDGISIDLNRNVLLFAVGASLLAALLIAAAPAWQTAGTDALRTGRGGVGGALGNRARTFLVAGEIALALALLAGAALMINSVAQIGRERPGFDPHNLLTLSYRVPRNKYPSGEEQTEFHRQVVEKIKAVPGVIAAAAVRAAPLGGNGNSADFFLADLPEPPIAQRPQALINFADAGFFTTMRVPLLRGRTFSDRDQAGGNYVVVINDTLARRYFGGRDPIGQRLRLPSLNQTGEIVGVVGDVKQFDLRNAPTPEIWGALAQNPFLFTDVVVRTLGDPLPLANDIRRAIWQVDKDQPVWGVDSLDQILGRIGAHGLPRLVSGVLSGYAAFALILAAIGVFGVVGYTVSQRAGEIGLRVALGASHGDIARLILRQGFSLAFIGIAVGIGAAAWLSRFLESQLYGVSPLDPLSYAVAASLLFMVTILACLIPVKRGISVNPIEALHHE
jgi:predicted permease